MSGYDIIGDVHGCASKLEGLLAVLGYEPHTDAYQHSQQRQAIFVGDLIDRGDEQVRTLEIVRAMVEAGSARIVMGNHEFNAISYATPNPEIPGEFMRPHNDKNRSQHQGFVEQVQVHTGLYAQSIEWFRSFSLYLDLDEELRVVHACWNDDALDLVRRWMEPGQPMSTEFVIKANQKGTDEEHAIEVLLKGPELSLEKYGHEAFNDKDGHVRHEARIRWWDASADTLSALAEIPPATTTKDGRPYPPLPEEPCADGAQYEYRSDRPVFYGHYWRTWSPLEGQDWTANTACVDFSAVEGGPLVAYRWSGEREIDPKNYVQWPESSVT